MIIKVEKLSKKYGEFEAVKNISFEVERGEVFAILGPNGAGKTTTLEMIEALQPIGGGSITLDGHDVSKSPQAVRHVIGIQLQSSNFYTKMKLREQLEMFASFYHVKVDPNELLAKVDLEEKADAYPENLSGGQRQRFSIATALVHQPKVLFLDEPTTGLDPQARRHLWELIRKIKDSGVTVVLTTHYMEEAELLADRIAVMDEGKIIALDRPEILVQNLLDRGFSKEETVKQADLEDVFIDLTGKELRE